MDSSPPPLTPLTWPDYYRIIRSQVEHEDNLSTQRLNWLLAGQAFLFTAYAIVSNADTGTSARRQLLLLTMLPLVALAVCALIFIAMAAGYMAMANLRRVLLHHVPAEVLMHFPPIQGVGYTRFMGMAAPLLLPPIFMFVWLWLLIVGR